MVLDRSQYMITEDGRMLNPDSPFDWSEIITLSRQFMRSQQLKQDVRTWVQELAIDIDIPINGRVDPIQIRVPKTYKDGRPMLKLYADLKDPCTKQQYEDLRAFVKDPSISVEQRSAVERVLAMTVTFYGDTEAR